MNGPIDAEQILDAYLAPEADRLPDRVIDAALADIARTPQRRASRAPWRFPHMPALTRATGIAAVALVAVVGAGSVIYLTSNRSGGSGSQGTPVPTATLAPTPALPAGITRWTPHTSEAYGFTFGVPAEWALHAPATRRWQVGDAFPGDSLPFAETFVSPGTGNDQIGLFAWEIPTSDGVDVESVEGLKAFAETFCNDGGASSCAEFARRAQPMCLNAGGDTCRAAILVPAAEGQYAFLVNFNAAMLSDDRVRVVVVARADDFPVAAPYGGSVALLKAILTTMDVWTTTQPLRLPAQWITQLPPGG